MTRARGDRLAGHDNRPPGRTFFPTTGIDRGGRAIRTFRRAALGAVAAGGSAAHLLPLGRAAGDATLQAVAADRWRTR
jgi:hypothetical protein